MAKKKKKDKPDNVVWDEEKGYYSKELTYGSNLSAPAITLDDVKGWRSKEVVGVSNQLGAKFEELKNEMVKLHEEFQWNQLIYSQVDYSFIPVIGHTYHLYKRDNGSMFMSLIEPGQWKKEHLGSFVLESTSKWKKLT